MTATAVASVTSQVLLLPLGSFHALNSIGTMLGSLNSIPSTPFREFH
jgi:hypothetical protein